MHLDLFLIALRCSFEQFFFNFCATSEIAMTTTLGIFLAYSSLKIWTKIFCKRSRKKEFILEARNFLYFKLFLFDLSFVCRFFRIQFFFFLQVLSTNKMFIYNSWINKLEQNERKNVLLCVQICIQVVMLPPWCLLCCGAMGKSLLALSLIHYLVAVHPWSSWKNFWFTLKAK